VDSGSGSHTPSIAMLQIVIPKRHTAPMTKHVVDLTGDYHAPIFSAARQLLAKGADASDTIETWRNGKLSMSGIIGECAKLTVSESSSLQLAKGKPFPAVPVPPRTVDPKPDATAISERAQPATRPQLGNHKGLLKAGGKSGAAAPKYT
jgi:hypothetical protein